MTPPPENHKDFTASSDDGTMKDFYFTFGFGHTMGPDHIPLANCYTIIRDWTRNSAVKTMYERRNARWANDYPDAKSAGVERHNLTLVPFTDLLPQEGKTR